MKITVSVKTKKGIKTREVDAFAGSMTFWMLLFLKLIGCNFSWWILLVPNIAIILQILRDFSIEEVCNSTFSYKETPYPRSVIKDKRVKTKFASKHHLNR